MGKIDGFDNELDEEVVDFGVPNYCDDPDCEACYPTLEEKE